MSPESRRQGVYQPKRPEAICGRQEQFARAIGANRLTVADWELGSHKPRGLYLVALDALAAKAKRRQK